jgi:hypothetical protein
VIKTTLWSCKTDKYWLRYVQNKSWKNSFSIWTIMPPSFPPKPRWKTRGFNVWKTSCNSHTHFAYFNSCQFVDKESSDVKHAHSSRCHSGGLTKFWGLSVHSFPSYSPYCVLKMFTFEAKPLLNPRPMPRTRSNGCHTYFSHCNRFNIIIYIFILIIKI